MLYQEIMDQGEVSTGWWRPSSHCQLRQAPFMGVIIGPRGVNHKRLQDTTGCKIFIRGRDIGASA